ncbi:MAG: hypothetical protein KDA33_04250, partial [Phycisphaerales bacterium]|nr:hypothetical protein [Phycisphaerales bacterium]
GKLLMKVGRHSAAVTSVAFDREGMNIVSCGEDHELRLWQARK